MTTTGLLRLDQLSTLIRTHVNGFFAVFISFARVLVALQKSVCIYWSKLIFLFYTVYRYHMRRRKKDAPKDR